MSVNVILDHGTSFTQWDKGRYVYVEGYDASADVKLHYTTAKNGVAFVVLPVWDTTVGKWRAGVPSTVLTYGIPVNVYVYDEDLDITGTVYKVVVPVTQKAQPADYIYDSYEDNVLVWPYEENIEAILRREQERISAEQSRSLAEQDRVSAEITRVSNETTRIQNETIRIQNEDERARLLQELRTDVEKFDALQKEITAARGSHRTLKARLDAIDDTNSVVDVEIEEDGSLLLIKADGDRVNIGQVAVGSGALGQQIIDIRKTAGTSEPGTTDTYTITLDTGTTYQFYVVNGSAGEPGRPGRPGVFIGSEDPGPDYDVWIDLDGEADPNILGVTFTPHVSPEGVLSWTNDGEEVPNPDPVNLSGGDGTTFTPAVSDEGILSWSNTDGKPNPTSKSVLGPSGVWLGQTDPPSTGYNVWVVPEGEGASEIRGITFTPHVSPEGVLSWTNDGGSANPESVSIRGADGIDGATFTPSVSSNGVLSWSNNKGLPNPANVDIKGPRGYRYTPSVSAAGVISWQNDGNLENPPSADIKGPKGDTIVFTPTVDANGNLSWENNAGLPNPQTVNIRGPQGENSSGGNADTLEQHPASYFATSDHSHDDATQSKKGFMSIADKTKMDTMVPSGKTAQDVSSGASPTFGTVTADTVIGAVYA